MLPEVEVVRGKHSDFLCFKTNDFISEHIRNNGFWGGAELSLAILASEGISDPIILDIGANLGAFSCPVAKKLNKFGAVIHAFEAQRIIFQQLCGNVFLNGLDNVHTYNVAVGATSGVIRIPRIDYQKTQNIGAVSLIPEIQKVTQVAYSETCYEEVKMQSIDSLDLKGKCTFVKIDVEGYESEVMAGMVGFIEKSCFPAIFFEEWRKGKFSGEAGITIEKRQVKTRELLS